MQQVNRIGDIRSQPPRRLCILRDEFHRVDGRQAVFGIKNLVGAHNRTLDCIRELLRVAHFPGQQADPRGFVGIRQPDPALRRANRLLTR